MTTILIIMALMGFITIMSMSVALLISVVQDYRNNKKKPGMTDEEMIKLWGDLKLTIFESEEFERLRKSIQVKTWGEPRDKDEIQK